MPKAFTFYSPSIITDFLLFCHSILCVPFELSPKSENVSSDGWIQVQRPLHCTFSICNWHPIVLIWFRCVCCHSLCWCCTLHRCSAWKIQHNLPHIMTDVALRRIPTFIISTHILPIF
jgi:hypothetical protein